LIEWASWLKLTIFFSLLANLFIPWDWLDVHPAALAVAVVTLILKLGILGVVVALVETSIAKLRLFRVPELLGMSFLLALLGVTSSFLLK
jgi:formate hydrogenlyase subunit 4